MSPLIKIKQSDFHSFVMQVKMKNCYDQWSGHNKFSLRCCGHSFPNLGQWRTASTIQTLSHITGDLTTDCWSDYCLLMDQCFVMNCITYLCKDRSFEGIHPMFPSHPQLEPWQCYVKYEPAVTFGTLQTVTERNKMNLPKRQSFNINLWHNLFVRLFFSVTKQWVNHPYSSFNSELTDWNSLPEDMRCLPYNAFKISSLKNFKSQ